jgi:DNA-binding NtrC family response regulator
MKALVAALLSDDPGLEKCLAEALSAIEGVSHLVGSESDLLDLTCTIGQHLDLAVIDCEHRPYGLTLVAAIRNRRPAFPLIAVTDNGGYIQALAYANGATLCFSKPVAATQLANAIKRCRLQQPQLATAT